MPYTKLLYCLALIAVMGCGKRQNIGFTGDSGKAKDTGVNKDQMVVSDTPSWDGAAPSDTIKWDRGRPADIPIIPPIPDTGPLKPIPCKDDSVCSGYRCENGKCRTSCWRSSHCAPTHTCNSQGKCVKKITCTDDKPCAPYKCDTQSKVCRTYCYTNSYCISGYVCSGSRTCIPAIPCTDDKPCKGFRCDTGAKVCRTFCIPYLPGQCASGYTCKSWVCT